MSKRSPITSHVLDTTLGSPAKGVPLTLQQLTPEGAVAKELASGVTDADGRCSTLLDNSTTISPGIYRVRFDTATYLKSTGQTVFYPFVEVVFSVEDTSSHYHIPLLLNPYGYSTYRGS